VGVNMGWFGSGWRGVEIEAREERRIRERNGDSVCELTNGWVKMWHN
jgi:hypothetical protein